jgi:hypothetical protein
MADRRLPPLTGEKIKRFYRKRGRPAFVPTEMQRRFVRLAMENGATIAFVAQAVNNYSFGRSITETTLRRHFAKEIELGRAVANAKVAYSAFLQATGQRLAVYAKTGEEFTVPCKPVPRMTIWWLETRRVFAEDRNQPRRSVIIV